MACSGVVPPLILLLALSAAPASTGEGQPCSPAQIVATAQASEHESSAWQSYPQSPRPDATTLAKARAKEFADAQLEPVAEGFALRGTHEVRWPQTCAVTLVRLSGFDGTTADGVTVKLPRPGGTISIHESRPPPQTTSPGPDHPMIPGAQFVTSTSVVRADWQLGIWRLAETRYLLAVFRPGSTEAPRPVLRSPVPVVDLSYLPAPDAAGGAFTILQRVAPNRYRWCHVGWGEEAIRQPASPGWPAPSESGLAGDRSAPR